jgi:uncharacterized membrane protein YfcA
MNFEILVTLAAILSAAIAAITGFGIGSVMTPLLNLEVELKVAVALVSIPHFVATVARFWRLRGNVDRRVIVRFGITSALGGLSGAYLNTKFASPLLTILFGVLLVFAGITGVTGLAQRMRFGRTFSWVAGFLSGVFGGLVGNQGGIRAAAMLTFGLSPAAFVATSTAIGVIVDLARMPIYFVSEGAAIFAHWRLVGWATFGVTIGTLLGIYVLSRLPRDLFQKVVSGLIFILGVAMLYKGRAAFN